jgi:hypothetical protein
VFGGVYDQLTKIFARNPDVKAHSHTTRSHQVLRTAADLRQ